VPTIADLALSWGIKFPWEIPFLYHLASCNSKNTLQSHLQYVLRKKKYTGCDSYSWRNPVHHKLI
jgi:hypothetical protein